MSLTPPQIRALLYNHKDFGWRNLGFVSTATSRGATGWVDPVRFGGSNYGEYQFADGWLRGQGMSSSERVKLADALSGTTLLHGDETAYAAPFDVNLTYEWTVPDVHPDALDRCIRDALQEIYTPWHETVTPWVNGNFNDGVSGWIAGSSAPASITETETASYNQAGQKSLLVTNNSAGDFATAQNTIQDVAPGQTWRLGAHARAVVGTGRFRVYNMTPATPVQIGESMDTIGFARARMSQDYTIPSGCYEINCRLEGLESNASVVWDFLPGFRKTGRPSLIELSSATDASFKLPDVAQATYGEKLSGGSHVWAADSRQLNRLKASDYRLEVEGAAATPNQLYIDRPSGLSGIDELWLMGRRPWSEIDALLDDTSSTDAPEALLMAAVIVKVCDLKYANTGDGQWQMVRQRYQATLDAQNAVRQEKAPLARRQHIGGRIGP